MLDRSEFIAAGIVIIPAVLIICILVGAIRLYRIISKKVGKKWRT